MALNLFLRSPALRNVQNMVFALNNGICQTIYYILSLCTITIPPPPPPPPPPPFHWTAKLMAITDFFLNYSKSPRKRRQPHDFGTWRFQCASTTLLLRFCYDPTATLKIRLRLVYADGDAAATLLRPRRWSYAFVALLYPFYIKSEVQLIYI